MRRLTNLASKRVDGVSKSTDTRGRLRTQMRLLCELLSQLSSGRIDSCEGKVDADGVTAEGPAEFSLCIVMTSRARWLLIGQQATDRTLSRASPPEQRGLGVLRNQCDSNP